MTGPEEPPPAGGFGADPSPTVGQFAFGEFAGPPAIVSDRLAMGALILGILSIPALTCCGAGFPLALGGIILGHIAQKRAETDPAHYGGRTSARVGFWTSVVTLGVTLAYFAVYAWFFFISPGSK